MRQLMLIAQLLVLVYGSSFSNANYPSQWNYEGPDTVHISYGNGFSNGGGEIFGANSYYGGSFTDGPTNNYEDENRNKEKVLNAYGEINGFGENNSNDRRGQNGYENSFGGSNREYLTFQGSNFDQYNGNFKSTYPDFAVGGNGYVGSYTDIIRTNENQNGGDRSYNTLGGAKNYRGPQYLNDVQHSKSIERPSSHSTRTNIGALNNQYEQVYNGYNQDIGKGNADQYTSISYNVGEVQDINTNGDSYTRNFGGYNEQANKNRINSGRDSFTRVVGIGKMYYGDGYTNMNVGAGSHQNNLNTGAINHYNNQNQNNFGQSYQGKKNGNSNFVNSKPNSNRFNNVDIFKSHSKEVGNGQSSFNKGLNINGQFMSDLETFKYGFMNGGSNIFNVPSTSYQEQSSTHANQVGYNRGNSKNLKNNRYTSTFTNNNGGRQSKKAQFGSTDFNNNGKQNNFEYSSSGTGVNTKDNGQSGQVRIHKHFYVHVPPPDLLKEETTARPVVLPPADTHYKIIFIKTPSQITPSPVMVPTTPEKKEKTLVYVLVKKPEEAQAITMPTPVSTPPSSPEVHFITYKTKQDHGNGNSISGRNEKQVGFSNLGGSFGNGGLSTPSRNYQQGNVNGYHKK